MRNVLKYLSSKNRRSAWLAFVVFAIVLLALPFFTDALFGRGWVRIVDFALLYIMLALGLNIVVGYAGLLDLGYIAFFAVGAYCYALLGSPQLGLHLPFWIVLPLGALLACIFGVLLGAPTLRLRGDYLAIVTLGFGEIIRIFLNNLNAPINITNGPQGISMIDPIRVGEFSLGNTHELFGLTFPSVHLHYYLFLFFTLLVIFISLRLEDSRIGRAWMAIREDELAAAQMGIDPVKTKLAAFAMGATFSGFAGAFYAAYIAGIFPSVFDFSASIIILCVVILGGIGNINGVIVGGLGIMTADRLFLPALKDFLASLLTHTVLPSISNPVVQLAVKDNANPILYRFLLFGLTLVIMMAVRPEGLLPNAQVRAELHSNETPAVEDETPKSKKAKKG